MNTICCIEFLWISTIFDQLYHIIWSLVIIIMKHDHRHIWRNSILICLLKMAYNILLYSFPSARNKFKSSMPFIFYQILELLRYITINNKFLPQLLILVIGQLLQILKFTHQLLFALFRLISVVRPNYKRKHLFRFVEKANLSRIVIVFYLNDTKELFK